MPQRRRRGDRGRHAEVSAFDWPEPTHADPDRVTPIGGRGARSAKPSRAAAEARRRGVARPRATRDPTSIRRYKAVPRDGGDRFQMQRNLDRAGLAELVPPCWRNKPTGTTDVFGRLWWDRPAFTIRTEFYKPEKGRYLHPSAHRPITVREAARCMSFDDDFELLARPVDDRGREADRQRRSATPGPTDR